MGKFVIKKTTTGFTFSLKATNGEVIATSQVYASESGCRNGIKSVQENAKAKVEDQTVKGYETISNPKYEVYLDRAKEYRFRLKAKNGEAIAHSEEGYASKSGCLNGIASVGKNAPGAEVVKESK